MDQTLHHLHPMARTVDHLHTLTHGGAHLARTNHRLMHRTCNITRGNKLRAVKLEHCACQRGMPCAPLNGQVDKTLTVDANTI